MIQSTHAHTTSLLQALNRAAATLQRESIHSPQAVYAAFRDQLSVLGLIGAILAYDAEEDRVRLETLVLPSRLQELVESVIHRFDLDLNQVTAPLEEVPYLASVIESGNAQFGMRHRATTEALVPTRLRPLVVPLLRFQDTTPGITAPIIRRGRCWGVLGITGENLAPEDCPTISAFANHLAIALDNATLLEEMKSANRQSRQAQSKAQRYLDIAQVMIMALDADGVIQVINRKGCETLGFNEDDLLGRKWFDLGVPTEDRDMEWERFQRCQESSVQIRRKFQGRVLTRSGGVRKIFWQWTLLTDDVGAVVGILYSGEDVTGVEAAAQALAQSTMRFRAIFNQTSQFIGILTPEGVVLEMNDAARWFFGELGPGMINRHLHETDKDGDIPVDQEALERLRAAAEMAAAGDPVRFDVEARRSDGSMRILDLSMTPIRDEADTIVLLLAEARDITEQRQATNALRQAQRTESLGLLAGGVAHDFNNLLVAMLGQTTLAAQKLDEADPARRHVEKAALAAERAGDLTRQLLAYAGQGQFQTRPIDLNQLVKENETLLSFSLPAQIVLNSSLARELPTVEADPGQIQRILMNLVLNARDAIEPQSGVITVRTGETTVGVNDEMYWQHVDDPVLPGTYVVLEVSDTGSGMDRTTLSQIFDPFFTTKPSGKGLGLSVVLGIMRSHSGGVRISSAIGKGTTFQLLFSPAARPQPPTETRVPVSRNGHSTVLVIDDDEVVGEAVHDILEVAGLTTLYRPDGESGLALLTAKQTEIDLVLLDFSMPGMSGEETLMRVQQLAPEMPVLLSSGYDASFTEQRLKDNRPVAFVQKPYRADTLIDIIRTHLP